MDCVPSIYTDGLDIFNRKLWRPIPFSPAVCRVLLAHTSESLHALSVPQPSRFVRRNAETTQTCTCK